MGDNIMDFIKALKEFLDLMESEEIGNELV